MGLDCDYFRRRQPLERRRAGRYFTAMTDQPPLSPWKMTPARIMLLALGVLALVLIVGAIGGVGNYQALRESTSPQDSSSAAASSSAP